MNQFIKHFKNKSIDYFVIKEKIGYKYHNIARYKNNVLNKIFLANRKCSKNRELYIVPEFKGVEGCYYRL